MTTLTEFFKHSLLLASWAVVLGNAGNAVDAIARAAL